MEDPTVGKQQRCAPLRSAAHREAPLPVIDALPAREMSNWPRLLLSNWRRIRTWGNVLSSEWDKFIFFRPAFVLVCGESERREEEQRGTRHRHTLRETAVKRLALTQISASTFCASSQPRRETGGANIVEQISANVNLLVETQGRKVDSHDYSNPLHCFYLWLCDGVLFPRPQTDRVSGQSQQSNPCCPCRMSDAPGQEVSHCPSSALYFALELWKQNHKSINTNVNTFILNLGFAEELKEIFSPTMKCVIIEAYSVSCHPNPHDFLSSVEHKRRR